MTRSYSADEVNGASSHATEDISIDKIFGGDMIDHTYTQVRCLWNYSEVMMNYFYAFSYFYCQFTGMMQTHFSAKRSSTS